MVNVPAGLLTEEILEVKPFVAEGVPVVLVTEFPVVEFPYPAVVLVTEFPVVMVTEFPVTTWGVVLGGEVVRTTLFWSNWSGDLVG